MTSPEVQSITLAPGTLRMFEQVLAQTLERVRPLRFATVMTRGGRRLASHGDVDDGAASQVAACAGWLLTGSDKLQESLAAGATGDLAIRGSGCNTVIARVGDCRSLLVVTACAAPELAIGTLLMAVGRAAQEVREVVDQDPNYVRD